MKCTRMARNKKQNKAPGASHLMAWYWYFQELEAFGERGGELKLCGEPVLNGLLGIGPLRNQGILYI